MRKYGVSNFSIKELETIKKDTLDKLRISLNEKEKYYIQKFNSLIPFGYNMTKGGENVSIRKQVPCVAYYIDGTKYKHFNSIIEASNFFHKNSHSAIGNALSKITKTKKSCGYFWVYKEDYDAGIINVDTSINGVSKMKHLYRFDLNGNFIKDYISINDFLRQENLTNGSAVTKAANNKTAYLNSFWSWTKENTFDYSSVLKYYEVDKNNNIIYKFKNLQEISNIHKKNTSCICVYISSGKILENGNKIIKKENYK